jgi:hypothetical protein
MKKYLIEFYLDWVNNFLTVAKMASNYGITDEECHQLIEIGRKYQLEQSELQALNKNEK